jgi:Uma2 family endonuclease
MAEPLYLRASPSLRRMSDDEFFDFCRLNENLRIERTRDGDLEIMPPTGGESGRRNFELTGRFRAWSERDGTGLGFDSSTGFTLPNGAKRSPDLGWVLRTRWEALTDAQREKFPPLCPDFVVEIRSSADSLEKLEAKLREYIENGARLGWLIDPTEKKVHVYRPGEPVRTLERPQSISGEPVLPGLLLDLRGILD